ncbi:hypothetical protein [Actinocrispum sp. NPDC049592]|uniref:hypothetical protein n=1 Tax=Actinocrispum sp. NPDC049592 TaxID=3154835 RepID=UPI00342A79D0
MTDAALTTTRRFLHGAAELLLAGPQWRTSKRITLTVVDGGFATITLPEVRVESDELLTSSARVPLNGRTYADVGAQAGLEAAAPTDIYHDGSGVGPDEVITMDTAALGRLLSAFAEADRALRDFAPDLTPVLWPEHFDVAISLDQVNYGVSPGDGYLAEPYAYVGPFEPRQGEFFNAPFGAARPVSDLGGAEAIAEFFRTGRSLLS